MRTGYGEIGWNPSQITLKHSSCLKGAKIMCNQQMKGQKENSEKVIRNLRRWLMMAVLGWGVVVGVILLIALGIAGGK